MSATPTLMLTGGTGFVGGHLAPVIARRFPHHRRVMVISAPRKACGDPHWEFEQADLTDESATESLLATLMPDIIIHMAAQSSVGQAQKAAEATWRVNVIGTFNLARAVGRHAPASLLLFTSTGDVYGASCLAGPADESTMPAPANAYAHSKLAAERIFQDILPPETRLIITRAFNHSGAGHDERFVLPSFASQIVTAERGAAPPVLKVGNLAAERDFLHVKDVVEAYTALVERADTLPMRSIVNVASGETWALSGILDLMLSKSYVKLSVVPDPARMRPSDTPRMVGNASRLRELTGWAPRLGVETIVDDLLAAFRAQT